MKLNMNWEYLEVLEISREIWVKISQNQEDSEPKEGLSTTDLGLVA